MAIIKAANKQIQVVHPELPDINTIDLCEIYGPAKVSRCRHAEYHYIRLSNRPFSLRYWHLCKAGYTFYAKGELGVNQDFAYESVLKTKFTGRIIGETTVGDYPAIIPQITGSAYITGYSQFMIDPEDPVKYGFALG